MGVTVANEVVQINLLPHEAGILKFHLGNDAVSKLHGYRRPDLTESIQRKLDLNPESPRLTREEAYHCIEALALEAKRSLDFRANEPPINNYNSIMLKMIEALTRRGPAELIESPATLPSGFREDATNGEAS